jgi:K+-sensing histidine kinase KdpD
LKKKRLKERLLVPRDEFIEVLRNLIHELSQPLTSLRGSLEVALLEETGSSEHGQVLEQCLEEAHRMAQGLGTLRNVLEAEDAGEYFQPVSWKQVVKEALKEVVPMAREKALQLIVESMADAYVKVNPPRFESVMRELLQQMILHGSRGQVIRMRLSVHESGALLTVCDGRLASDANATAKETKPATRLAEALYKDQPDWWILRRSIEGQGGRLEIEKNSRGGLCCRVYIPLASSEIPRAAPPRLPAG